MSFIITSCFINDFVLGDNINYNLEVLGLLYKYYGRADGIEKKLLRKPITVLIITIIEAVLYDFVVRIKRNVREGVEGLGEVAINSVRSKNYNKFRQYVEVAEKYNFFESQNGRIYRHLKGLSKLRNRLHIQNFYKDFDDHERDVFTDSRMEAAEKSLEFILKKMVLLHPRPSDKKFVNDFSIPWGEHFKV